MNNDSEVRNLLEHDRNVCKEFLANKAIFTDWEWDARFSAHLSTISTFQSGSAKEYISTRFGKEWDRKTIKSAPAIVSSAANAFGGLQANQIFFSTNSDRVALLFCAWWPWGNGKTISVRIGYHTEGLSSELNTEIKNQFLDWVKV